MKISYIGHASFRIELNNGVSIVTDPFDPSVGYDMPFTKADIVTVSHAHHDHNYIGKLDPEYTVSAAGVFEAKGVRITGIPSYHDEVKGAKRGENVIFVIEADGVRIAHLGDLGNKPDEATLKKIGTPDVLMIPVGGVFTLDAKGAAAVARTIGARYTIPMHYSTPKLSFGLGELSDFLREIGGTADRLISFDPKTQAECAPIVILEYGQGR